MAFAARAAWLKPTRLALLLAGMWLAATAGCGTTNHRLGTEQLLMSDAVDQAISQLDFRYLSGRRVYLNTSYILQVKSVGFVNAEYIISALRQQLTAAHCLLQDRLDEAEVVVEPRVGALGNDSHQVVYGLPATSSISQASSIVAGTPLLPPLPEISVARIDSQSGIAKLYVFAYERDTKEPIWQSGVAKAESNSRNTWILGAGPIQRGSIHDGLRFAGRKLQRSADEDGDESVVAYDHEYYFTTPAGLGRQTRTAELPIGPPAGPPLRLLPLSDKPADDAAIESSAESASSQEGESPDGAPQPDATPQPDSE